MGIIALIFAHQTVVKWNKSMWELFENSKHHENLKYYYHFSVNSYYWNGRMKISSLAFLPFELSIFMTELTVRVDGIKPFSHLFRSQALIFCLDPVCTEMQYLFPLCIYLSGRKQVTSRLGICKRIKICLSCLFRYRESKNMKLEMFLQCAMGFEVKNLQKTIFPKQKSVYLEMPLYCRGNLPNLSTQYA